MAKHQAIAATSNALLGLLRDRYPRDEFGTSLDFQLYQSRDFETPMREGFSVFLYRVTINGTVRLTAGHLNHYVAETDIFAPNEGLEIICDPLALVDYLTLWDRLRHRLPTSITYAARMLSIDSDVRVDDGSLAQTRRFDMGEVVS